MYHYFFKLTTTHKQPFPAHFPHKLVSGYKSQLLVLLFTDLYKHIIVSWITSLIDKYMQTWEKVQTCKPSSHTILTKNVDILDKSTNWTNSWSIISNFSTDPLNFSFYCQPNTVETCGHFVVIESGLRKCLVFSHVWVFPLHIDCCELSFSLVKNKGVSL